MLLEQHVNIGDVAQASVIEPLLHLSSTY